MGKQNESKINTRGQLFLRSLGSKFAGKLFYNWVYYFHFYCALFSSHIYTDAAVDMCSLSPPMQALLPL